MILLTQEAGEMSPIGIIWIIIFAVVVGACIIYDRRKRKNFNKQTEQNFEAQKIDGNNQAFITSDHELVVRIDAATWSEYNIFKLNNVAYIYTARDKHTKMWMFGLYDQNKKDISGIKIKSPNGQQKKQNSLLPFNQEPLHIVELVQKYVPNAKHVGNYFKEKE